MSKTSDLWSIFEMIRRSQTNTKLDHLLGDR